MCCLLIYIKVIKWVIFDRKESCENSVEILCIKYLINFNEILLFFKWVLDHFFTLKKSHFIKMNSNHISAWLYSNCQYYMYLYKCITVYFSEKLLKYSPIFPNLCHLKNKYIYKSIFSNFVIIYNVISFHWTAFLFIFLF